MYVIIWQYRIKSGCENEFENVYGPQGDWVKFFRNGVGYVGTDLLRDGTQKDRYLTLDYWRNGSDYELFREQNRAEYEEIDRRCERLTTEEIQIGLFDSGRGAGADGEAKQGRNRLE